MTLHDELTAELKTKGITLTKESVGAYSHKDRYSVNHNGENYNSRWSISIVIDELGPEIRIKRGRWDRALTFTRRKSGSVNVALAAQRIAERVADLERAREQEIEDKKRQEERREQGDKMSEMHDLRPGTLLATSDGRVLISNAIEYDFGYITTEEANDLLARVRRHCPELIRDDAKADNWNPSK